MSEKASATIAQPVRALHDHELEAVSAALNFCDVANGGFVINWRAGVIGNPAGTQYRPVESMK